MGMGGKTDKAPVCRICEYARHSDQRGAVCPHCLNSMKRGANDERFRENPQKRSQAFVMSNPEYKQAVIAVSLQHRAAEAEKLASLEEIARQKSCKAIAT